MTLSRAEQKLLAYEHDGSLASWPPTRHDVPTLWSRAKELFAVALMLVVSTADLARRMLLSRQLRRDVLARLKPVEKLVRLLMIAEAAAWLSQDKQGRHLRATAKPVAFPIASAAPSLARRLIPMPGWHTIAALRPRIDPRVEERRQRELAAIDPLDPKNWTCRFQVLRIVAPQAEPQPAQQPRRLWAETLDLDALPISPRRLSALDYDDAADDRDQRAMALARRIEALARVLANPGPAIRRLARRLAGMPLDDMDAPVLPRWKTVGWHHGAPEAFNACDHASNAVLALVHNDPRPPEPG